jgi:hypothetical protein
MRSGVQPPVFDDTSESISLCVRPPMKRYKETKDENIRNKFNCVHDTFPAHHSWHKSTSRSSSTNNRSILIVKKAPRSFFRFKERRTRQFSERESLKNLIHIAHSCDFGSESTIAGARSTLLIQFTVNWSDFVGKKLVIDGSFERGGDNEWLFVVMNLGEGESLRGFRENDKIGLNN